MSRKSSVSEETQKGPQPLSPTPSGRLLNASTLCSHHVKAWNLLVHIFRVDGQNNRITDRSISQLRYYHSIIFGYCYDHSRYFRSKLQPRWWWPRPSFSSLGLSPSSLLKARLLLRFYLILTKIILDFCPNQTENLLNSQVTQEV